MRNTTRLGVVIALGTATVLGACGGKADNASAGGSTAAAGAGASTGTSASTAPAGAGGPATPADSAHGGTTAPASTARMSDNEIVSLTQASDEGEIATSQIALKKATNPDVRNYAQQMIREHTQMISQRNALVKAQNLQPAAGAKDSIANMGKTMVANLNSAPRGVAFDTAYMNGQAMSHANTLAMAQKAEGVAQNAALKAFLAKGGPIIQKHLDEAKSLQGKLAGGAGGAAGTTGAGQ